MCLSRLRIIDARKMEKLLFKLGFEKVRQKGSHVFYRHPDGRTTSLSVFFLFVPFSMIKAKAISKQRTKTNCNELRAIRVRLSSVFL